MAADRVRSVLMTADTVGGVWHYALELAAALGARGVRVALATMGAPLNVAQRDACAALPGLRIFESGYKLEWMNEPWGDLESAGRWLEELAAEIRPDVVHLNQFAFAARRFKAPTLLVAHSCVVSWWQAVHGCEPPCEWDRYRALVRAGVSGASLLAAPTAAMLCSVRANYGYDGAGVVIPNARRAEQYAPQPKAPLVLAAGRLWDEAKNLAALEAVAPQLAWPVCVAGATSHPDGGERSARGVRALGELTPAALASELARAAIYALPARYEPFGLSVLEAALAGCALVLGDIPSLRETWGDAALYVAPEDRVALRSALERLIDDPLLRERIAAAARARALLLTPGRKARAYLTAYSTAAASYRSSGNEPQCNGELHACAS